MRKVVFLLLVVVLVVGVYIWYSQQPPASFTVSSATPSSATPPAGTSPSLAQPTSFQPDAAHPASSKPHAGVPGSSTTVGCGDGLWEHVYHPQRLKVFNDCTTVTGVIVDATAPLKRQRADGVRHEADGDTHGWLKVDPEFADLINAGNVSDEGGNLVFELVCHFAAKQADAQTACVGFTDSQALPPVGSRVSIKGSLVLDTNHGRWNEIHPVSSITAIR